MTVTLGAEPVGDGISGRSMVAAPERGHGTWARIRVMGELARAWAAFRAKSPAERSVLLKRVLQRAGDDGIVGALKWIRQGGAIARSVDRYREWCQRHTPGGPALEIMREA